MKWGVGINTGGIIFSEDNKLMFLKTIGWPHSPSGYARSPTPYVLSWGT